MPPDPMNSPHAARVVAQPILAPLSRSAIFLVATLKPGADHRAMLRSFCGDLGGLFRAVDFRNIEAGLSCVMGIGSPVWCAAARETASLP
jgi:putative iron-dependent peroxidase